MSVILMKLGCSFDTLVEVAESADCPFDVEYRVDVDANDKTAAIWRLNIGLIHWRIYLVLRSRQIH
jgi:hypothetical protein